MLLNELTSAHASTPLYPLKIGPPALAGCNNPVGFNGSSHKISAYWLVNLAIGYIPLHLQMLLTPKALATRKFGTRDVDNMQQAKTEL